MKSTLMTAQRPVLTMWVVGAAIGLAIGIKQFTPFFAMRRVSYEPLPHQISKYPGGISLRFAMVHDVIHERFPLHGQVYYRRRNELAKNGLEETSGTNAETSEVKWRLMDDLAVGQVHLDKFEQAIAVMREKLTRQEKEGISGRELYSTYANLGTAMMIDAITQSSAGKDASDELRQSLTWVRKSIEVNPQAHFGREVWQVVLGEYLLAVEKDPTLAEEFDFIGDALEMRNRVRVAPINGRPESAGRKTREFLQKPVLTDAERQFVREWITPVGAEWKLKDRLTTSSAVLRPFDEPVLGIVGMWRYGGGANPYFSMALAEIMRRVGQAHIAWAAYERTFMLLDGPPSKEQAKELKEHCRGVQREIESKLEEDPADLRAAFNADLKAGLDYQAAYQKYEAAHIDKGDSIDDPHFYDAFFAEHGDIASDPGNADSIKLLSDDYNTRIIAPVVLLGGLFAFLGALACNRSKTGAAGAE